MQRRRRKVASGVSRTEGNGLKKIIGTRDGDEVIMRKSRRAEDGDDTGKETMAQEENSGEKKRNQG